MFSEEDFKNMIFYMSDEKDDYTISYYVSQHFGVLIGETWTSLTCHATRKKITSLLIYHIIGRNITEIKSRPISHEKIFVWTRAVLP